MEKSMLLADFEGMSGALKVTELAAKSAKKIQDKAVKKVEDLRTKVKLQGQTIRRQIDNSVLAELVSSTHFYPVSLRLPLH